SPLKHTWSLAVEEQWYLIWPIVVIGLLKLTRRANRDLRPALAVVATACVASTIWMAILYTPGHDPSRVYYGTDTRAQQLLAPAPASPPAPTPAPRSSSPARSSPSSASWPAATPSAHRGGCSPRAPASPPSPGPSTSSPSSTTAPPGSTRAASSSSPSPSPSSS